MPPRAHRQLDAKTTSRCNSFAGIREIPVFEFVGCSHQNLKPCSKASHQKLAECGASQRNLTKHFSSMIRFLFQTDRDASKSKGLSLALVSVRSRHSGAKKWNKGRSKKNKAKLASGSETCNITSKYESNNEQLFKAGQRVILQHLPTDYNHKMGIIQDPLPCSMKRQGKYHVLLDGHELPVSIPPQNLGSLEEQEDLEGMSSHEMKKALDKLYGRKTEELRKQNHELTAAQIQKVKGVLDTLSEQEQIDRFGRTIQTGLHQVALETQGRFPDFVKNYTRVNRHLLNASSEAVCYPHFDEESVRKPEYQPEDIDIDHRLGPSLLDSKREWYFGQLAPGDIFPFAHDHTRTQDKYPTIFRHSFSNQAYRSEILHKGTTHVAVGFVDLGVLLAADLAGSFVDRSESKPLNFVGVEQSPYSVAKTLVIWEMLEQISSHSNPEHQKRHLRNVAQVWFSAIWDEERDTVSCQHLKGLERSKIPKSRSCWIIG